MVKRKKGPRGSRTGREEFFQSTNYLGQFWVHKEKMGKTIIKGNTGVRAAEGGGKLPEGDGQKLESPRSRVGILRGF